jgi:cell division protein FtsB
MASFFTGYPIFDAQSQLVVPRLALVAGWPAVPPMGGSFAQVKDLTQQIADQHAENERLLERNRVLDAEVLELKKGTETVEERARHELGMVKEGETLYQLAQ